MPEAVEMTQTQTSTKNSSAKKKSLSKDKVVTAKVTLLDGTVLDVNVDVSYLCLPVSSRLCRDFVTLVSASEFEDIGLVFISNK